jgi:hypothetical protein
MPPTNHEERNQLLLFLSFVPEFQLSYAAQRRRPKKLGAPTLPVFRHIPSGYDNDDDDDDGSSSSSYDDYKVLLLQQLATVATRIPSLRWILFGGRLNTISNNWPQ